MMTLIEKGKITDDFLNVAEILPRIYRCHAVRKLIELLKAVSADEVRVEERVQLVGENCRAACGDKRGHLSLDVACVRRKGERGVKIYKVVA